MPNFLNVPSGGASTPNQAGFSPGTTTFDLRAQITMSNWTPAASAYVISNFAGSTVMNRYTLLVTSAGLIDLAWYDSAVALQNLPSTVSPGFGANTTNWIRALATPTAGTVQYFTAPAGSSPSYTALGTTRTGLSTNAVNNPASPQNIVIGQSAAGSNQWTGNVLNAQLIINGVTIFDMDWTTASLGTGPWASGSGETWTDIASAAVQGTSVAHNLGLLGVGA